MAIVCVASGVSCLCVVSSREARSNSHELERHTLQVEAKQVPSCRAALINLDAQASADFLLLLMCGVGGFYTYAMSELHSPKQGGAMEPESYTTDWMQATC